MTKPERVRKYGTVLIASKVHYVLKLASAAERTSITEVLTTSIERWMSGDLKVEGEPPGWLTDNGVKHSYVNAETHLKMKVSCYEKSQSMTTVSTMLAINWLKNHGHQKLLDRFVSEAKLETG